MSTLITLSGEVVAETTTRTLTSTDNTVISETSQPGANSINVLPGTLSINGYAPTLSVTGGNISVLPGVGSVSINGYAPTVVRSIVSGTVTSDIITNNTNSPLTNVLVRYSWFPAGRIGALLGITPIESSGITNNQGRLVVSNLQTGPGVLLIAQLSSGPDSDGVYYQALTAV